MKKTAMRFNDLIVFGLAILLLTLPLCGSASAQYRDRHRDTGAAPSDTGRSVEQGRSERRTRPSGREVQRDERTRPTERGRIERRTAPGSREVQRDERAPAGPASRAAPGRRVPDSRRVYDRPPERDWQRDRQPPQRKVYVPQRWVHVDRPHYRALWPRHYSRVWWCGSGCRIGFLFGFTVWAINTVVSADSVYSFPTWEALEYNRTGETSLWESDWGYVEFTPTRTFRQRFGRHVRDCRDFLRVVVRNDGLERRYRGTACRNPDGAWWIVS